MRTVALALIGLSALAFILAVIAAAVTYEPILRVSAEGYSRGCSNLALLAIALGVWLKDSQRS